MLNEIFLLTRIKKGDIKAFEELLVHTTYHVRGDLYFKNKSKRLFLNSMNIHSWFEIVTCKIDIDQIIPLSRSERISTNTIFADTDFKYDEQFWKEFNTIPLEEEITKIIKKVALKIEQIKE